MERFSDLQTRSAAEVSELGRELAESPEARYLRFLFYVDAIVLELRKLRADNSRRVDIFFGLIVLQIILLALVLWRVW